MVTVGTGTGHGDTGTAAARAAVRTAREGVDRQPECAVVFASSEYEYESVVETIRTETDGASLIGASSAGEFTEAGAAFESVTVTLLAGDELVVHTGLGEGVREDLAGAVERATEPIPAPSRPHRVGINLHDGLVGRGEEIAMVTYQEAPMPYVGGSAADDLKLEQTAVFADGQVATDAVAVCVIESQQPFGRAVGHGHEPVAGPFEVTQADGSTVSRLDDRPAYDVWADAVETPAREQLDIDIHSVEPDDDRFEELLTRFEFGIKTGEDDYKVRWPGLTPTTDGPLEFATKIPTGTRLHVMDSGKQAQLSAADTVSDAAVTDLPGDPAGALAFDCVCQAAILGDEFERAVDRMSAAFEVPFAGMQTYGEVAIDETDLRAYHNTTSSVVVFPE